MEPSCDLEVDVNGEEIFLVSKKILFAYSGKLRKVCGRSTAAALPPLRVIFHDLPGGAAAFELISRFCYSRCGPPVTPAVACTLHCAATFMEMTEASSSSSSLISQTEKALEGIPFWTWPELLAGVRQCQEFPQEATSAGVLSKLLHVVAGRIILSSPSAAGSSNSDSSPEIRFSGDSAGSSHHRSWWVDELPCLNPATVEKLAGEMIARQMEHSAICRFLLQYLRSKLTACTGEKKAAAETVVELLFSLSRSSVNPKSLFGVLHFCAGMKTTKLCRIRLEKMIAMKLDEANLDNLLVRGGNGIYDVDLVLRLLRFFVSGAGDGAAAVPRLKRLAALVDLYLAEVAPEKSLKAEKFAAVAMALPAAARDCFDGVYRAVDVFLEVHAGAMAEERERICAAVDYAKLSSETCSHLAGNPRFPPWAAVRAIAAGQAKMKTLLRAAGEREQIVIYARKMEVSAEESEKLRTQLRGMQWRVAELEKLCRRLQSQVRKMAAAGGRRSLPRLCS